MTLLLVGVDFQSTPLELRESLVFNREEILRFLPGLLKDTDLTEAVLLSTCNRTELYAVSHQGEEGPDPALAIMAGKGLAPAGEMWARKTDRDAIEHLFHVAAGLRSMVKGETQILGQVREAYRIAVESMTTGAVLNRAFHAAIRVGKRVRAETGICEGAVSVSQAAVELLWEACPDILTKGEILVLGAGEMAALVVKHLAAKKIANVHVINRSLQRAEELAKPYRMKAHDLGELKERIERADVLFSAVAARRVIVAPSLLNGRERPLQIVDISLPRSVDPSVAEIPQCTLKDIDTLKGRVDGNLERRETEAQRAATLIHEEVTEFLKWTEKRKNAPLIQSLVEYMEGLRARELQRVYKLDGLTADEKLERLSTHIIKKITQPLIKKINDARAEGDSQTLKAYLDLLRKIYRI
ncbi:MAG: glutamyl-tRNA reductase [Planctomycetota bacterium]|jgi:glutamyl-tRNA reductase